MRSAAPALIALVLMLAALLATAHVAAAQPAPGVVTDPPEAFVETADTGADIEPVASSAEAPPGTTTEAEAQAALGGGDTATAGAAAPPAGGGTGTAPAGTLPFTGIDGPALGLLAGLGTLLLLAGAALHARVHARHSQA